MFKKVNQENVEAKLFALSLIYEKEESCRQAFLERIFYTPQEIVAVIDSVSDAPEFRDWIKSVIPAMQCREDDENGIYALIDDIEKDTKEIHSMNKKLFAAHKRHFKERHAEATSQIPKLVEKVKQVDGAGNKIKTVLEHIPASIKESIEKEKERNKELREIRRSGGKKSKTKAPSDEIFILGLGIKISKRQETDQTNPNQGITGNSSTIYSMSMNSSPQRLDDSSYNSSNSRNKNKNGAKTSKQSEVLTL